MQVHLSLGLCSISIVFDGATGIHASASARCFSLTLLRVVGQEVAMACEG